MNKAKNQKITKSSKKPRKEKYQKSHKCQKSRQKTEKGYKARMPRVPRLPRLRLSRLVKKPRTPRLRNFPDFLRLRQCDVSKSSKSGCFWKNRQGFWKKTTILFKIAKRGRFAVERVSNGFSSQTCFPPYLWSFVGKNIRKLGTLENLEGMMKKDCFFKRKSFHFLKNLPYKNGC